MAHVGEFRALATEGGDGWLDLIRSVVPLPPHFPYNSVARDLALTFPITALHVPSNYLADNGRSGPARRAGRFQLLRSRHCTAVFVSYFWFS